jgi:probable F420-dependent oxidoreductase
MPDTPMDDTAPISAAAAGEPSAVELGRVGVWSTGLRFSDPGEIREAVAELDELGYGAAWFPGSLVAGSLDAAAVLLEGSRRLAVASGITNIWMEDAGTVRAQRAKLVQAHPGRFLLGLGVSHGPAIGERYQRPLSAMREYLDQLDAAPDPVPMKGRVIAALGPRMLELARDRAVGTHTLLMPPEHCAEARATLGPDKLVAPEMGVVLETDPTRARELGRQAISVFFGLPNYMNNVMRCLGFGDEDLAGGGSNRLVDALVAWGGEDAIRRRMEDFFAAGADHVCIQVVGDDTGVITAERGNVLMREQWRRLAPALL